MVRPSRHCYTYLCVRDVIGNEQAAEIFVLAFEAETVGLVTLSSVGM
jgi:hypothetical protein